MELRRPRADRVERDGVAVVRRLHGRRRLGATARHVRLTPGRLRQLADAPATRGRPGRAGVL